MQDVDAKSITETVVRIEEDLGFIFMLTYVGWDEEYQLHQSSQPIRESQEP